MFFPYETMRPGQKEFYKDCVDVLNKGQNLIANVPTGIGKTAAVLSASLEYALANDKIVIFLTSRHSQHNIAIDTLKLIKQKTGKDITSCDIINKQDMCLQHFSNNMKRPDFESQCYHLRKKKGCKYYEGKNSAYYAVKNEIMHVEEIRESCEMLYTCPYYLLFDMFKETNVIVADYNYLLDPGIRDLIKSKTQKNLQDFIIIFDEGHNIPQRIRNLDSYLINKQILIKSRKEIDDRVNEPTLSETLRLLSTMFNQNNTGEAIIPISEFKEQVNTMFTNYFLGDFGFGNFMTLLQQGCNKLEDDDPDGYYLSSSYKVLLFFKALITNEQHRINVKKSESFEVISLDPSILSKDIFKEAHSTILMSGTLYPPSLYANILGIDNTQIKNYLSPFPPENKYILVDTSVTSRYSKRNELMYNSIGKKISEVCNLVPGNVACFFPSYKMIENIARYINTDYTEIYEQSGLTKEEKNNIIESLKQSDNNLLLGVQSGSFSEGIDFKNNILKAVILVGLPLDPPSLEKNCLIKYYDEKCNKGKQIAYILPLVTKILQSSGRLIRSSEDKGVIILMDDRYAELKYSQFYPKDFDFIVSDYINMHITKFFNNE